MPVSRLPFPVYGGGNVDTAFSVLARIITENNLQERMHRNFDVCGGG